jgi:hypothetical protein
LLLAGAEPRSKGKIPAYLREGPHAEGVTVGPKERKLPLAPRVDRATEERVADVDVVDVLLRGRWEKRPCSS